jgi:3-oxoacyl-[acyl-carrier protein] reductase
MPEQGSDSQPVAVVTGGLGGIGRACTARLARDGFAVVISFGSNSERADTVLADIREYGGAHTASENATAGGRIVWVSPG